MRACVRAFGFTFAVRTVGLDIRYGQSSSPLRDLQRQPTCSMSLSLLVSSICFLASRYTSYTTSRDMIDSRFAQHAVTVEMSTWL